MLDVETTQELAIPPLLLKARPEEKAGKRLLYIEASTEGTDLQNEEVALDALWKSRDYYLAKGNVDLDHISKIGLKMQPPVDDYYEYEIGRPRAVDRDTKRLYVEGVLYRGNKHAENVWKSLTECDPPQTWFASVAGAILKRQDVKGVSRIVECRWSNVALTQEAVNQHLKSPVSTRPLGPFAKVVEMVSCATFAKALTAGYGTDSAGLTGGAALRHESLHGAVQEPYRRYKLYATRMLLRGGHFHPAALAEWAHDTGASSDESRQWSNQFLKELLAERERRAA